MDNRDKNANLPDDGSSTRLPAEIAATQKAIADGIENAIGIPASIEEEMMLEAAELLEVELPND